MDLDRLANASRVMDQLESTMHVFRKMNPQEQTPIWYQIAATDIQDVAYVIHQVQRLLYTFDRAIETLVQIRHDA